MALLVSRNNTIVEKSLKSSSIELRKSGAYGAVGFAKRHDRRISLKSSSIELRKSGAPTALLASRNDMIVEYY
jgi:hypothetical protein